MALFWYSVILPGYVRDTVGYYHIMFYVVIGITGICAVILLLASVLQNQQISARHLFNKLLVIWLVLNFLKIRHVNGSQKGIIRLKYAQVLISRPFWNRIKSTCHSHNSKTFLQSIGLAPTFIKRICRICIIITRIT